MSKQIIRIVMICVVITNTGVYSSLNITPIKQDETLWCWAASMQMVFQGYGITWDQSKIADYAISGSDKNVANYICGGSADPEGNKPCQMVYSSKNVNFECERYNMVATSEPAYSQIHNQIHNAGRPVHIYVQNHYHNYVAIDAYERGNSKTIVTIDPEYPAERAFHDWDISVFSAALLEPSYGINDEIRLVEDNFYNPDYIERNQTASFKSQWVDHPDPSWITEFRWKIEFFYNGSCSYVAKEKRVENVWKNGYLYWRNVSVPALPSGKYWRGLNVGNDVYVEGRLSIWVYDSDGYSHTDSKTIWYKNPGVPLIPADLYLSNKRIRQYKFLEGKATNSITTNNITAEPNSQLKLTAGNQINISDGGYINFQNGSIVDIIIDPSIQ